MKHTCKQANNTDQRLYALYERDYTSVRSGVFVRVGEYCRVCGEIRLQAFEDSPVTSTGGDRASDAQVS